MRIGIALSAAVVLATLVAPPADAKTAGTNGQISYDDETNAFVINPDGSGQLQLNPPDSPGCCATWSPDGTRLAMSGSTTDGRIGTAIVDPDGGNYGVLPILVPGLNLVCNFWSPTADRLACQGWDDNDASRDGIYTARTDGLDVRRVTVGVDTPLDFKPDGTRILFERQDPRPAAGGNALFTVNVDGTGLQQVTAYGAEHCCTASWSPDGRWIVFGGKGKLWLVHPDGTSLQQIPLHINMLHYSAFEPSWAPDGTHIVFAMAFSGRDSDIYTVAHDGTGLVQVTDTPGHEGNPNWGTHPVQP